MGRICRDDENGGFRGAFRQPERRRCSARCFADPALAAEKKESQMAVAQE